ncbi:MAG: sulfate adenylyltransferase, partial [Desulfobacteraceae bacterium]|nr:sulfate adenylyltransferase [Desulfobacteraceae bacterium]
MNNASTFEYHGGPPVQLIVNEERATTLKEISLNLPDITLNDRQLCDLELLATGVFSPLDGFMTRSDYESVLDRMRLQSNVLWPIPICLGISDTKARTLEVGQSVTLRDHEGFLLAIMHIEDMWPVDREKEASLVYGTTDPTHQGVNYLLSTEGDYYVGGKLEVLSIPLHFDFKQLRMTPQEIRRVYQKLKWKRILGFQTRNPIQRLQFEMTVNAMRQAKANLLLLPVTGMTKPGDFDHYTRVRCYRAMTRHYPPDSFVLNLLPLSMRLAGAREALLHTIIAKNYGCTHFVIGRDHASPGTDAAGKPFYESRAAQELTEEHSGDIGVTIIPFEELVYLPFEDEYRSSDQIPEGEQYISFSSSDIRERI